MLTHIISNFLLYMPWEPSLGPSEEASPPVETPLYLSMQTDRDLSFEITSPY